MKSSMITIILILILALIAYFTNWQVRDKVLERSYDFKNSNPEIYSKSGIDKVFQGLEKITYDELSAEYLNETKSGEAKYQKLLESLTYYKISQKDFYKRIVGRYRIKDFICKDDFYIDCVFDRKADLFLLLNKKLIYKTLELFEALEKRGYNKNGFQIINGHRHPKYNERIGGAKLSRHIKGEAVDLIVNDVNNDGYGNKMDKDIILDLLEREIIGNEGGIGLYPGTGNVHYDVRGSRARWDSY